MVKIVQQQLSSTYMTENHAWQMCALLLFINAEKQWLIKNKWIVIMYT